MKIKDLKIGQIINVQAYKHNGRLYRQWNGVKVLEITPFNIVLFMYKTKVLEDAGQRWVVREPMLWWMPLDEFYNTTGLVRPSGTHFYTNLSSPPIYEDGAIKFIDYDLDIKAYPGLKVKVVDQGEYKAHSIEFNYEPELMDKIEETTTYVQKLIENKEGYFDEDVVDTYIQNLIDNKILPRKFEK